MRWVSGERRALGARYDHELRGLGVAAFAQVDANYTSRQQFAVEQDPLLIKKGYTLVDASVGVRDLSGRYMLTLFVRNLFDKSYETDLAHGSILLGAANFSDLYANFNKDARRYIGATLGVSF